MLWIVLWIESSCPDSWAFFGVGSWESLGFWRVISNNTHHSFLYPFFPLLFTDSKAVADSRNKVSCTWHSNGRPWVLISALSASGGTAKGKVFPSFLQKSTLGSGNTQLPSICSPTTHGLPQTSPSPEAPACVFSCIPSQNCLLLTVSSPVGTSLSPTTNPPCIILASTRLLLFQLTNFWRDLEANQCYRVLSSICVTTVNVSSNVRFQFRDTGSQFLFSSLQMITEEAHVHTHSHASLMKTTFVLSCFVLLHNEKNPSGSKHLCSLWVEKHTFCQHLSWRDTLQGYPVCTFPIVKQRVEVCIWGAIKHPLCLPLCQRYQFVRALRPSVYCWIPFQNVIKMMGTPLLF